MMFIDLDGFKQINDTHGHAAGDEVLKATAARLRAELRESEAERVLPFPEIPLIVVSKLLVPEGRGTL